MTSEIRANTLKNRVGLGTVSFTNTGPVVSGIVTANTIRLADDNKIQLGDAQDLEIVHDSANGVIRSVNSGGNMHVESKNHIELNVNYNTSSGSKENALKAIANSGVSLFFNGAQKLQTTNTGATVNGTLVATTFDGNVTGNISGGTVAGSTGTFSGDVSITDKIIHTDDTNTAIRFPAADTFTVETNNTERFRIGSNGYIGVGNFTSKSRTDPLNVDSGIGTCNIGGNYIHLSRYSGSTNYITAPQNNANLFISADDFIVFGVDHSSSIYTHSTEALRILSNGDISIGGQSTATQKVDILNGTDEDNIVIIRGADTTTEYAAVGVNNGNAIITGGSSGSNNVGIIFRTANSGTETQRLRLTNGGVLHVGNDSVSNTIPSGGLDLQGNGTNCVLEMGNPFPGYSGGMVPEFRITTVESSHTVEFRSVWGGTNGLYKHMSMSGGATMFYDGVDTEDEIMRITGSAVMVGTTSNSANTQAKGIALNDDGSIVSRRDGVMHYYKSIATGGYYANVFMSANTTVGSIFFNSGGTQFNTSSDYRRKENVVSLTDGLSKLKQLKPYRFNFKDNPSVTVDGFLAHEAQEIVPHTVTGTKDQVSTAYDIDAGIATTIGEPIYQQMDLSKLVPLLTAALQEETAKREALEARVAALEG